MNILKTVGKKIKGQIWSQNEEDQEKKPEKYIAEQDQIRMDKVNLHQIYNKNQNKNKNLSNNTVKVEPSKTEKKISINELQDNQEKLPQNTEKIQELKKQAEQNCTKQYHIFSKLLNQQIIDYKQLKTVSWQGIPPIFRSIVWKITLDYMPTNKLNSETVLNRKREEYWQYVENYYLPMEDLDENEAAMRKIVIKDVYRTQPNYEMFKHPRVTQMLERILYIWSIRHPACGYVQGMNEIVTTLIIVFLQDFVELDQQIYEIPDNIHTVKKSEWDIVEADSYWCLTRILDRIQDNYTNGQPGIKKSLNKMQQIVQKLDPELADHFQQQNVQFVQFAFRWILCILVREFELSIVLRIFDTYISDEYGLQTLHVYVCATFVLKYSSYLKTLKFNEIIMFLQNMPTKDWQLNQIEELIQQGYTYCAIFEQSQGHIKKSDENANWF